MAAAISAAIPGNQGPREGEDPRSHRLIECRFVAMSPLLALESGDAMETNAFDGQVTLP
jgi:hypothetical protein